MTVILKHAKDSYGKVMALRSPLLINVCDNVKALLLLRIVTINYGQRQAVVRMALQDTLIHLL